MGERPFAGTHLEAKPFGPYQKYYASDYVLGSVWSHSGQIARKPEALQFEGGAGGARRARVCTTRKSVLAEHLTTPGQPGTSHYTNAFYKCSFAGLGDARAVCIFTCQSRTFCITHL